VNVCGKQGVNANFGQAQNKGYHYFYRSPIT